MGWGIFKLCKSVESSCDESINGTETVANKIRKLFEISGGFGVLLGQVLDYSENKKNWHKSLRLLSEEVIPSLADLKITN